MSGIYAEVRGDKVAVIEPFNDGTYGLHVMDIQKADDTAHAIHVALQDHHASEHGRNDWATKKEER